MSLSPELAQGDPQAFTELLFGHLVSKSPEAAVAWNYTVERGEVEPSNLTFDPSSWVSTTQSGAIRLGVAPMDQATKEGILFKGGSFTYSDEIAYRLNHENTHALLVLKQNEVAVRGLMRVCMDARTASDDKTGLTALGSLDFYRGRDKKVVEDTVELMAMRIWNRDYAQDYIKFLSDARANTIRESVGLSRIDRLSARHLGQLLDQAVVLA